MQNSNVLISGWCLGKIADLLKAFGLRVNLRAWEQMVKAKGAENEYKRKYQQQLVLF